MVRPLIACASVALTIAACSDVGSLTANSTGTRDYTIRDRRAEVRAYSAESLANREHQLMRQIIERAEEEYPDHVDVYRALAAPDARASVVSVPNDSVMAEMFSLSSVRL